MATKKYLELQNMDDADLMSELTEAKAEYSKLRFDHAITGLENPLTLRNLRRDIARLNTEIRKRELAKMTEQQLARRSRIIQRRKLSK